MSIKWRFIISMLGMVVFTMLTSIIIVSVIVNRQNKNESNQRLRHAFDIVADDIMLRREKVLSNAMQVTEMNEMGTKICLLQEYKFEDDISLTMHTRHQIIADIYNIGVASKSGKIVIYDIEGDIVTFSYFAPKGGFVGYRQILPANEHGYRKIPVEQKKDLDAVSSMSGRVVKELKEIQAHFEGDIPKKETVRFELVDNFIALVAYAPIMRSLFDIQKMKIEKQPVGFVKVVQVLDQSFVEKLSYLTDTKINVFLRQKLSVGVLADQKTPDIKFDASGQGRDIRKQEMMFGYATVGETEYYQGLVPVYADSGRIGSIQTLYSMDIAQKNTFQMILLLSMVGMGCILISIPVVFFLTASISKPVEMLTRSVRRITQENDLSLQAPVVSDDEIGQLAQDFNQMSGNLRKSFEQIEEQNEKLRQADKLKDEFLANTSHELRTPLNGIIGIADSMLDRAVGPLTEEQRYNLSLVVSSGRRLTSLISDILDFSELRQRDIQLRMRPLDMRSVTNVVLMLSQTLVGSRDIRLVNRIGADLPAAHADENRVQQILHNLVGNAVKFTDAGTVSVSAGVRDEYLAVTVSDTGIGIPEESLERIFGSFEQADGSTAREYGGTGLGLAVTRNLVELHGGHIRAESVPGKGSHFTFMLPVSEDRAEAVQAEDILGKDTGISVQPEEIRYTEAAEKFAVTDVPPERICRGSLCRILVVDDEPVNLQVLRNQLVSEYYSVIPASNGREALDAVESGQEFDLVLLDIMMPGMSGYEVCRHLRERYRPDELPVMMLTARNRVEDLVAGFEAGANDYLTKPFMKDELLARVGFHIRLNNETAERKKAEEELRKSEERFRNLFENSPISLWEEDFSEVKSYLRSLEDDVGDNFDQYLTDHPEVISKCAELVRITDINRASLKLHGAETREELLENLAAVFTPDSYKAFRKEIVAIREGRHEMETDAVVQTLDGIPRYVSLRWQVSSGHEETFSRVLVSVTDISERKKSEDRLAAVNIRLEELVNERTRELAKTTEEARAASRAKSEFLARMSHEIRTPMNGIIGLTGLVLKSDLTSQQKAYLKKVRESSDHLLDIINDILDFSKIEEGKLETDTTDFMLNHVISRVADIIGEKAAEKEVELFYVIDKAVPLSLRGDPLRMNQILINLVGNAVKFTERGEIVIRVRVTDRPMPENETELLFSVRDTGIGISPEKIEALFDPFTQADGSVTRKYGGTGLGLAICRQLVHLMGGRIWAEGIAVSEPAEAVSEPAEEEGGSTFCFTLPFALQSEERRRVLLAPEDVRGLKVLVADDNEAARIIFREMLEAFGSFQVTVADSGKDALDKLKRALYDKPYDLVIVDWRMPDTDGFELARQIRSDPLFMREGAMPRIIMVTMYGRGEVFRRTKAGESGIDAFLHKPVSSSEMFNSVMEVFGREDALVPRETDETGEVGSELLAGIRGARILLAEDNEINRNVAVAMLEGAGLITEVAENGREAVEMLRREIGLRRAQSSRRTPGTGADAAHLYDLVLMDIEMPEMDGHEATRIIRGRPEFDDLPIIAMTAHAMKGDREKCLDAGMSDYLPKPVDEQQLYALLCKWIKPGKREVPEGFQEHEKRTPESGAGLPGDLPGIDLKTALRRVRGDAGLLRMMLGSFLEKYEHAAGEIGTLLDRGKLRDAHKLTHTIKGVSGNLCADALFAAARELDSALREEKTEDARPLLEVFAQKLTQFTDALKTLNPDEESGETGCQEENEDADLSQAGEILTEMTALLEKNQMSAWRLLDPLLSLLPDSEFRQEKAALRKAMSALDTEGGISVLLKLSHKLDV